MSLLEKVDEIRKKSVPSLDANKRGALGQYFTPAPIALFMASLFRNLKGDIHVLDPGCGPCSLTAAFCEASVQNKKTKSITATCFDIEESIKTYAQESLAECKNWLNENNIEFHSDLKISDFIVEASENSGLFNNLQKYTHAIINPPYKKISTQSRHRKALKSAGIETVNLYSGFISLAVNMLIDGGEIVAIVPRSFCNGPYYKTFRESLLKDCSINHIHIFDSRNSAFKEDNVLQENIIFYATKEKQSRQVTITSSPTSDFHVDMESGTVTAPDMTSRTVDFEKIVKPTDKDKFIHIAANSYDQAIIDRISCFTNNLSDLKIEVSTGPVVDFRLKDYLKQDTPTEIFAPLIYPVHLDGHSVQWPKSTKKPNAILVNDKTRNFLWRNNGFFVITKRFSSKEEKKRISATLYNGNIDSDLIGFENKTNVFHRHKEGLEPEIAAGLQTYLNSTLLDRYYRIFGGHTQVNATDFRSLHYPDIESLRRIGSNVLGKNLPQQEIDNLIDREIFIMTGSSGNPLQAIKKIEQALEILHSLGMPPAQINERSALTFLALTNITPNKPWKEAERPMKGVTPIMNWCSEVYGKTYAPNTRETFRRQTLHQFHDGGIVLYNPDDPSRAVNSPKACYQIASELHELVINYGSPSWDKHLEKWLENKETLTIQYARAREMAMTPLTLDDGTEIKLSPGIHSELISEIVNEFGPRFAPGSEVIYLGDTGAKGDFFREERLKQLGVTVDKKGKLPDVVLYWPQKNWLLLVESVTSHGPVDGKRHGELSKLFESAKPGLVYVTAFPDKKTMNKFFPEIAWETEVWVADAPTHMIHFNGDRFLGPH